LKSVFLLLFLRPEHDVKVYLKMPLVKMGNLIWWANETISRLVNH